MADKKSDIFQKQDLSNKQQAATEARADTAVNTRQAQEDKDKAVQDRTARDNAADATRHPISKEDLKDNTFSTKHHKYIYADPPGPVPTGQWGAAVWSRDEGSQEWPCFLDNKGEWWWATTTAQNGINPAVEKTEAPVGWRML